MDEKIERPELKNDSPASAVEESTVQAVETPAEDESLSPAVEGEEIPENPASADGMEEQPAEEEPQDTAEDPDAPLVMSLPAESMEAVEMPAAPAPAPVPAGPAEKLFTGLSCLGLPVLLILAAAMTFLEVWQIRDLWCAGEARLAEAVMNMKSDWLTLSAGGQAYVDNPPLYIWFTHALSRIPHITEPMAIFLAVASSHALFIGSIWALARGTGHDRRSAFAAGLVALCCVFISGLACLPGTALLFAATVALGMTCLYRGWIKSFAPFWLAAGFLLMGVATLIDGPMGIVYAVVSSVLFLFWRGTPGRLNSRDGLPGFFLMLLMVGAWLGALYLGGHTGYIRELVNTHIISRLFESRCCDVWWFYLAALPIVWLPWILVILFVNWFGVLRGIPTVWKTRKNDGGSSWLWIWLVTGAALLSCLKAKEVVYALPLLAPMAVLIGRSVLRLSAGRSRCFFGLSAALMALAGLTLVLVDVYPFIKPYIPAGWLPPMPACLETCIISLDGTMYMGAVLILLAVILLSFTRLALPGGALLITAIGMVAFIQPFHFFVVPSLEKMLAPAPAAVEQAPAAQPAPAVPADESPAAPAEPAVPAKAEPAAETPTEIPAAPAEPAAPAKAEPATEAPAEASAAPAADAAPAEKPAEAPVEKPADAPAPEKALEEKPAETPAPAEAPASTSA